MRTSWLLCLKGYLAPFMDTMGIWSLWNNIHPCNWKNYTQQLCAWLSTIFDAEKNRIFLSRQLCCL